MKHPIRSERFPWILLRVSLFLTACLAMLLLASCQKSRAAEAPAPPPPVVEVVDVVQKDVPVYLEGVGTMDGMVNATIRAQVQGYLIRQNYKEGDFVKKGQILFEIDPRTFEAALKQVEAALEQAKAQATGSEVQHANAQANLKRYQSLATQKIASEKDLEDAVSAERSAKAAVAATQAAVSVAQAAVNKARLDLDFTKIVSPIDGIAGIAQAQVGDLVGPSQTGALTTVSTVDPIKVYYPISEQFYINHMKQFANASAGSDPPQDLEHELILADGAVYPQKGKLYAIDRQVDNRTGTLRVEALFPNPGNRLRPGQFARVRVAIETKAGALLVPQQAVTELQGSYQVAVVGPDNRVAIRPVDVGDRVGNLWVIDAGLKPGERVVAEGVQKVKQGTLVNPKPFVSVTPAGQETSPKPENRPTVEKK